MAVVAVVIFAFAWIWCGMAYAEEFSEEPKAQAAGTTMAGWGLGWGLVPVLVFHGLVVIGGIVALRDGGRRGVLVSIVSALALVALVSLPGFVAVQLLFGGTMFEPPVYVP